MEIKEKQRSDIKSNKWMKEIQCSTECIIMFRLNESHTWYDCWRMRSCDRDDDRTVWQNSERRCCSASSSLSYRTPHSPCLPQNYTVKRVLNRAHQPIPALRHWSLIIWTKSHSYIWSAQWHHLLNSATRSTTFFGVIIHAKKHITV